MTLVGMVRRRAWPLGCTLAVVVTGMVFTLTFQRLARHAPGWDTPEDFWGIVRASHYIQWGSIGYIYSGGTGVLTLPGFEVLLAPLAWLTSTLRLSESFPIVINYPTGWLLLGPIMLATDAVLLVAVDCLAEKLGVSSARRRVVCVLAGLFTWPALVVWGHPDDVVALGLALFAVMALNDGRTRRAGWLIGMAIAIKLDVALALPILAMMVPRKDLKGLIARAAAIPAFLAVVCIGSNPHDALRSLVTQPEHVFSKWSTPWLSVATRLGHNAIAGGSVRRFSLVVVVVICGWLYRHAKNRGVKLDVAVWSIAAVLACRLLFEAQLYYYYFVPALVLFVVVAARGSKRVAIGAAVLSTAMFVLAQRPMPPWARLVESVILMIGLAAWSYRAVSAGQRADGVSEHEAGGLRLLPAQDATTGEPAPPTKDANSPGGRTPRRLAARR